MSQKLRALGAALFALGILPAVAGLYAVPLLEETEACATFEDVFGPSMGAAELTQTIAAAFAENKLCGPDRLQLEKELETLVRKRKALFLELVEEEPRQAADVPELPSFVKAKFPEAMQDELFEKRGEARGRLSVVAVDDFENGKAEYEHFLDADGQRIQLFPETGLPVVSSGAEVAVQGVRLEGKMAVFRDGISIRSVPRASSTETTGVQSTLVILVERYGQPALATPEEARRRVFGHENATMQDYYARNAYGKVSFEGRVVGPYDINACGTYSVLVEAVKAADPEVYFPDYERIILLVTPVDGCTAMSQATIGKQTVETQEGYIRASVSWIFGFTWGVLAHEMGHNLGLAHANGYSCKNKEGLLVPYSFSCESMEYRDPFDVMGTVKGHFSAPRKETLGWLNTENSVVAAEGTFFLKPLESQEPPGSIQQIKLPLAVEANYYAGQEARYYSLELRRPLDYDAELPSSVFEEVLVRVARTGGDSADYSTNVVSMHPDLGWNGMGLKEGESFRDDINGYLVTADEVTDAGARVTITRIPRTTWNAIDFAEPVLYYDFNEGKLAEQAGVAEDDAFSNKTWPREGGLLFAGTNSYLRFRPFPIEFVRNNNGFTISTWTKIARYSTRYGGSSIFLARGYMANEGRLLAVTANSSHGLVVEADFAQAGRVSLASGPRPLLGAWHHLAATYDGKELATYVDGVKAASIAVEDEIQAGHYGYYNFVGLDFDGVVDEFKIFARGLGEAEVRQLYAENRYVCGDVKPDRIPDVRDIVALIDYVFRQGTAPEPLESGDADGSGVIDDKDVWKLVDYVFRGGAKPTGCGQKPVQGKAAFSEEEARKLLEQVGSLASTQ